MEGRQQQMNNAVHWSSHYILTTQHTWNHWRGNCGAVALIIITGKECVVASYHITSHHHTPPPGWCITHSAHLFCLHLGFTITSFLIPYRVSRDCCQLTLLFTRRTNLWRRTSKIPPLVFYKILFYPKDSYSGERRWFKTSIYPQGVMMTQITSLVNSFECIGLKEMSRRNVCFKWQLM